MKIRRYLAKDVTEAMDRIKRDFGEDAVIISNRKIRQPGLRGFFQPHYVEITVAYDDEEQKETPGKSFREIHADEMTGKLSGFRETWKNEAAGEKQVSLRKKVLDEVCEDLFFLGIDRKTALWLLDRYPDTPAMKQGGLSENTELLLELREIMSCKFREKEKHTDGYPAVWAFAGPPGVGKTTTIAKIAAQAALFEEKDVALITIDTFRIGAVQQLQLYGEIMDIPVGVATSAEEMAELMEAYGGRDLILVDTAGKPSKNMFRTAELKKMLDQFTDIHISLVLSAATKERDVIETVKKYKILNYDSLIFTKTDETSSYGNLINGVHYGGKPILYLTNGQNVPEDIMKASPEEMTELILKDVKL